MEWKLFWRRLIGKKRVTAHTILKRDGKFLLVQECGGAINGLWGLPGGGVKKGETPEETAKREAKEEAGYDIRLIRKIGIFEDQKRGSSRNIFLGEIVGGELQYQKQELMDAKWFTLEEIGNLRDKLRGDWVWEALDRV